MDSKPLESDWKVFRKRVPHWRERYLETKNKEIVGILADGNKTPTEQFWEAKKRMDTEARFLVELLDGHSRSKMQWYLILMYGHRFIADGDLDEFSDELQERIRRTSDALRT